MLLQRTEEILKRHVMLYKTKSSALPSQTSMQKQLKLEGHIQMSYHVAGLKHDVQQSYRSFVCLGGFQSMPAEICMHLH